MAGALCSPSPPPREAEGEVGRLSPLRTPALVAEPLFTWLSAAKSGAPADLRASHCACAAFMAQ